MAKRFLLCVLTGAAILVPSAIAGRGFGNWRDDVRDMSRVRYDASLEQAYPGIVMTRGHLVDGLMYFTLRVSDKNLEVQIGPQKFVESSGFKFKIGETVTVVGMPLAWNGHDMLLARRVNSMTSILIVRDRDGHPMWDLKRPIQMDPELHRLRLAPQHA